MMIHMLDSVTKRHSTFHRPGHAVSEESVKKAIRYYFNIESAPGIILETRHWHEHKGTEGPFHCFCLDMVKEGTTMCLTGIAY